MWKLYSIISMKNLSHNKHPMKQRSNENKLKQHFSGLQQSEMGTTMLDYVTDYNEQKSIKWYT